ncbi:peptidoglycan-binding protein, partial [Thioclava sp. BHET1]
MSAWRKAFALASRGGSARLAKTERNGTDQAGMTFLKRLAVVTLSLGGLSPAAPALAQSFGAQSTQPSAWVQIEARPTLAQAEARARAYAGLFPHVEGFGLSSGWFAIVLGPYDERTARVTLSRLLAQGMIPPDSFLSDGSRFTAQYWPEGNAGPGTTAQNPLALSDQSIASAPLTGAQTPAPDTSGSGTQPAAPVAPVAQAPVVPETPAEARRSEAQLSAADRKNLQSALQWYGFYASTIDGAFGPGTRNAMAAWQQAQGDTPTGILTTAERGTLLASYRGAITDLGMQQVDDTTAGISVAMPTKLVQFGDYAPPFAHYTATGDSGVQVVLLSQPGGQEVLDALYNSVQRLAIVPASGPRSLQGRSFDITGQGHSLMSYTHAEVMGGAVKGFTLVWPPAQNARMERVVAAMKQSFRALNGNALDATAVPISAAERQGLLAGLELKKPAQAASGFYVDARGQVLTSAALVAQCKRVTIGNGHAASVVMSDPQLG